MTYDVPRSTAVEFTPDDLARLQPGQVLATVRAERKVFSRDDFVANARSRCAG